MSSNFKKAYSLIEMAIVILMIALFITAIAYSSRIMQKARIAGAKSLTRSAPVRAIEDLAVWFEPFTDNAFLPVEEIDGGLVSLWNDSGQGAERTKLTQSGSARPVYTDEAINKYPALTFTASSSNGMNLSSPEFPTTSSDSTVFLVVRPTATGTDTNVGTVISAGDKTAGNNAQYQVVYLEASNTFVYRFWQDNTTNVDYTFGSVNYNTQAILSAVYSSEDAPTTYSTKTYRNGTLVTTDTTSETAIRAVTTTGHSVGYNAAATDEYFNGNIGEIIVYKRALTDVERRAVEDYLSKKWKIAIAAQ